ncbi:MAG: putative toxin-antitoxin system toxin component, PIN family [Candidatus Omnitrophica bacterium]|nr:putative toxin-antitoxin system toxin component, PIN family [Candidatus Omnitrophota bacterium]MBU1127710.1 putative toxin-antitoxin system toxin component, PIN family [Candidatus Omnitrophota bacterium]
MLKVVIDTNVFISGLLNSPSCRYIIKLLGAAKLTLIISPWILDELIGVISRPKFRNAITRETAEKIIEMISIQAVLVNPSREFDVIEDDPADNRFIDAAIEANADFIISGDRHLLDLKTFHDIRVITPAQFLKTLKR